MRKTMEGQLSIFDIVIDREAEAPVVEPSVSVVAEPVRMEQPDRNLCPYKVPTVNDIIKRIDSAAYKVDRSQLISDVFECGAISISNAVDFTQQEQREERYKQIMGKYQPAKRELLADIFGMIYMLLSSVVYDNGRFSDYLGELFMRCNQGNSKAGQYFTPYHISQFMAKAAIGDDAVQKAEDDGILTVCDPCCGGGGMMIAALDTLKNDYGINYARHCFIECSDIDLRCVHMTYLQLALAGVPAIIKHQNSLTRELWSVWKTPAFIFQYARFCQFESYA